MEVILKMIEIESVSETNCSCKSIFTHDGGELSEAFTSLWIKIINKKEAESQVNIANADVLDL